MDRRTFTERLPYAGRRWRLCSAQPRDWHHVAGHNIDVAIAKLTAATALFLEEFSPQAIEHPLFTIFLELEPEPEPLRV